MQTPLPLRAACLAVSAGLVLTGPALTGTALGDTPVATPQTAVGGALLATRATVVSPGSPPLPVTEASGWLVADLDTGAVLAAKDPHGRYAPASTLKTLTAQTLLSRLDPRRSVRPTFNDVNVDGTRAGLVEKLAYPVPELFRAMLVASANDAADTLASANGGVVRTARQMNAEALRLQAKDTHAVNVNGLDAVGQTSSPYDLALIARAAMKNSAFRAYVATRHTWIAAPGGKRIALSSHDKLLYNYPGAIGIKNGYTVHARASFVGAATQGGHTLVVVLMHTAPRYWPQARDLLDWGFAATRLGVAPVGQLVEPIDPNAVVPAAPANLTVAARAVPQQTGTVDGPPLLAGSVVGAGVLAVVGGVLRQRRRGRRRLTLPRP